MFFVGRYSGLLPPEDLEQEGRIGLAEAIKTYKPTEAEFSTYAGICISRRMLRAIADEKKQKSGVNSGLGKTKWLVEEMTKVLKEALGRSPDVDEIAEALSLDPMKIQEAQGAETSTVSLDQSISQDGEGTLEDLLPSERGPDPIRQIHLQESLKKAFKHLTKQELYVLGRRYGLNGKAPHSYKEIADELRISKRKVISIERHAFSKLRTKGNLVDCL